MQDYSHILQGLPVMYLIVVVAIVVVIGAMCMDAAFGWRKTKLRNEARTAQPNSRSLTGSVVKVMFKGEYGSVANQPVLSGL